MKNNKNNSNKDYFIEKWYGIYLKLEVLSETLDPKRLPNLFPSMEVLIKYQVLNDKYPTNVDETKTPIKPKETSLFMVV